MDPVNFTGILMDSTLDRLFPRPTEAWIIINQKLLEQQSPLQIKEHLCKIFSQTGTCSEKDWATWELLKAGKLQESDLQSSNPLSKLNLTDSHTMSSVVSTNPAPPKPAQCAAVPIPKATPTPTRQYSTTQLFQPSATPPKWKLQSFSWKRVLSVSALLSLLIFPVIALIANSTQSWTTPITKPQNLTQSLSSQALSVSSPSSSSSKKKITKQSKKKTVKKIVKKKTKTYLVNASSASQSSQIKKSADTTVISTWSKIKRLYGTITRSITSFFEFLLGLMFLMILSIFSKK